MIGEGPGAHEDATGYPFVGKAGTVLNQILSKVHYQFQYLITNLVCCRPVSVLYLSNELELNPPQNLKSLTEGEDYELYDWNRAPTKAERELCAPHIDELAESYQPHGVVYLGSEAQNYQTKLPSCNLLHPAFIARKEYKLITIRKEARKIDNLLHILHERDDHVGTV